MGTNTSIGINTKKGVSFKIFAITADNRSLRGRVTPAPAKRGSSEDR